MSVEMDEEQRLLEAEKKIHALIMDLVPIVFGIVAILVMSFVEFARLLMLGSAPAPLRKLVDFFILLHNATVLADNKVNK